MADKQILTLNDGNRIPMLAFGTGTAHVRSKAANTSKASSSSKLDQDCINAIKTAIRIGFRHLDTAELYGTEPEVGIAVSESIREGTISGREELFITTKVERDPIDAEKVIERCLERLGPDIGGYVDLFLIHGPYFTSSDDGLQSAWAAMERVRECGKARSIGVSNYEVAHLEAMMSTAKTPPAINQIEYHPYMTLRKGQPLLEPLRVDGVAVSAYGALTPVTNNIAGPLDEVLARLANKYGVSPGVICLKWCAEQDVVVITTSQKEERMKDYLQLFHFELKSSEMEQISSAGQRCLDGIGELKPRVLKYVEKMNAKGTTKH